MKQIQKFTFLVTLVATFCGLTALASAQANHYTAHLLRGGHRQVCDTLSPASGLSCDAKVVTDKNNQPAVTSLPTGYGPVQFHTAYQLPSTSAKPGTIAIVDAYDDPNIASDLATYDKTFGLPVFPTCANTTSTSCFLKVNQNGSSSQFSLPPRNTSWGLEISLDVETAHQICQNCKVVLVEASSASYNNLMAAVDRARLLGATAISNSYGSSEFSSETSYDSHFNFPGLAFIFSAGDGGYGAGYPAASPDVTAAGGTSLTINSSTNAWQSEAAWADGGSGCSLLELKPAFQTDSGCSKRTVADVAADADPNTGAAIYDSYGFFSRSGWLQVGGTSLASPIIAGIYALANNITPGVFANSLPYSSFNYATNLHDITAGSNGSCSITYLCHAGPGYDGPTGLGSPDGLGAF